MDEDTASSFGGDQTTVTNLVRARKHNPLLRFHKSIIRDIAGPEEDDLLVLAKGLGLRRVSNVAITTSMILLFPGIDADSVLHD